MKPPAPQLPAEPVTNPGIRTALLVAQGQKIDHFIKYVKAAGAALTVLATLVGAVGGFVAWLGSQRAAADQAAEAKATIEVRDVAKRVDSLEQRTGRIEDKQDRAADKLDVILLRLRPKKKEEAAP